MSKEIKQDIPQEAFDWYDDYAHGGMDRRTFMAKLGTLVAVGSMKARNFLYSTVLIRRKLA